MTLPKITKAEAEELLTQHTKEPWKTDIRVGCVAVYPASVDHNCLAIHQDNFVHYKGGERDESGMPVISEEKIANANRIVACVNACEGMEDPAEGIANMMDAMKYPTKLRQDKEVLLEAAEYALSVITEDKWLSYEDEAAGREGAITRLKNAIDITT